jgi:hypothetical protein
MSTATSPRKQPSGRRQRSGEPVTADVLVIFGITGDLAKVMTFRSLYRLEPSPIASSSGLKAGTGRGWTYELLRAGRLRRRVG